MKLTNKKILSWIKNKGRFLLVLVTVLVVPLFSGCGTQSAGYHVSLEIWGTLDDSTIYNEAVSKYKDLNPYIVDIKYRKFSQDTYKQDLLDALASGQGPDIFLMNNSWLPSFENKLEPAPIKLVSEQDVNTNFPDVVATDFVDGEKVYGVPLSVDSMQLYYNKDTFNLAGITAPPKTWQEFSSDVQMLTRVDAVGNISRSGTAMGTSQNVSRSMDILSLLMIQNGAQLPTSRGMVTNIDQGVISQDGSIVQAGEQALGFYTQFSKVSLLANIPNPVYCWNSRQINSMDAFASGNVAMFLGYSWQGSNIKNKNPKLNFAVAPVPQLNANKPASFANYWGYAVAKNRPSATTPQKGATVAPVTDAIRTHEAWQFLRFLTLKNSGKVTLYNAITKNSKDFAVTFDPAIDYLKKTNQPAARRDIINLQRQDTFLGSFATGNLIAKSWYQVDPETNEKIFAEGIDSINRGDTSLHQALVLMKNRLDSLMQTKNK
ncbi:MAG: extracellular solute-binding protein [Candidatus Moraniibacteriota bacterium]